VRPEDLIVATSAHGADASKAFEVPGTGPHSWTVAEAGMACAGMARHVYFAMLYSYAGDTSCHHELLRALLAIARSTAEDEGWPEILNPGAVAMLVLAEEHSPAAFTAPANRPDPRRLALRLPLHSWKRFGRKAYEGVHGEYRGWLDDGRAIMRRWMRRGRA
jgi:hypothetical protein